MTPDSSTGDPYIVRSATKVQGRIFACSILAIAAALYLELIVYPQSDVPNGSFELPVKLNGWAIAPIAALTASISGYMLIRRPILLQIDGEGVSSTLYSASIPWHQIRSIRHVQICIAQYIVVSVHDPAEIVGGVKRHQDHWGLPGLTADEVPISVTVPERPIEEILERFQAEIDARNH